MHNGEEEKEEQEEELWPSITKPGEPCCLQVSRPTPIVSTSELGMAGD